MASSHGMDEHFPASSAGTIPAAPPELIAIWVTCGYCWGQRRQYIQDDDARWYGRACPACNGLGETMKLVDR